MALVCRWRSRPQHHNRTDAVQQTTRICTRHSITSSAMLSSVGGTVKPSILAVW